MVALDKADARQNVGARTRSEDAAAAVAGSPSAHQAVMGSDTELAAIDREIAIHDKISTLIDERVRLTNDIHRCSWKEVDAREERLKVIDSELAQLYAQLPQPLDSPS